jgi:hypothetical protein
MMFFGDSRSPAKLRRRLTKSSEESMESKRGRLEERLYWSPRGRERRLQCTMQLMRTNAPRGKLANG